MSSVRPGRVFVAEDDVLIRTAIHDSLSIEGIDCHESADGKDALQRIRHEPFDLVLLDNWLPNLNGSDVTRLVREDRNSPNQHTPIVIITACPKSDLLSCGADGYLKKPFRLSDLNEVASRWLSSGSSAALSRGDRSRAGAAPAALATPDAAVDIQALKLLGRVGETVQDEALTAKLINCFCAHLPPSIHAIKSATSPAQLSKEIHRLKSSCLMLGARGLASALEALESKIASGENRHEFQQLLERIESEALSTARMLRELLRNLTPAA